MHRVKYIATIQGGLQAVPDSVTKRELEKCHLAAAYKVRREKYRPVSKENLTFSYCINPQVFVRTSYVPLLKYKTRYLRFAAADQTGVCFD
jgi:hypothetical protein